MPTKKKTKTKKARTRTKKDFSVMMVKQVMQKQVPAVHLKTKGDVVASLMVEGFGAVPVVDAKDKLLGIVSEHDLLAAVDDGHKLGAVTAGDIMTCNPYSIHPEAMLPTLVHICRVPAPAVFFTEAKALALGLGCHAWSGAAEFRWQFRLLV